jgi:hypothetical protein
VARLEREHHVIATPTSTETLEVPLDGLVEAEIRLAFGGGQMTVGPAKPGMLISGTFEGGVIQRTKGPGRIELQPASPGRPLVTWRPVHWDVGLTPEIPVDLHLDTGGNKSIIDLTQLRIRRLELQTGASETTIRLPAAGQTSVRVACGFASVAVEVPHGVAARIRGKVSLGSTQVDETRFPRVADGWASADYESALDRVDIAVEGGFGSVRVG